MALQLGDSMMVGPVEFPPRRIGAQLIQRGPHGMMFAQGPQRTKDGRYVWWQDQMIKAGDYERRWRPQQKVVGVYGLGARQGSVLPLVVAGVLVMVLLK